MAVLILGACKEHPKITAEELKGSMWSTAISMVHMSRLAFAESNEMIGFTSDNSGMNEQISLAFRCTFTFDEPSQTVTMKLKDHIAGDSATIHQMVDGKKLHLSYDGHALHIDGEVKELSGDYFKSNHDDDHHHHH